MTYGMACLLLPAHVKHVSIDVHAQSGLLQKPGRKPLNNVAQTVACSDYMCIAINPAL